MLSDPFNRSRKPATFDREDRVRLLGEAAAALLAGNMPSDTARLFLASGLLEWLESGGDLLGDYWRVKAPAGSHHTPAHLWASSRGAHEDSGAGNLDPDTE